MDLQLKDWRCLVTGGTGGIGRGVAELLVEDGAKVVVVGRDKAKRGPDGVAGTLHVDLATPDGPSRVVKETVKLLGGIDAIVANAGAAVEIPFEKATDKDWQDALDLNVFGLTRLMRDSLPYLRQRKGRVVVVTALSGHEPRAEFGVSNFIKAGLRGITKTLSREFAKDGVLFNCVAPGRIRTPQTDRYWPDEASRAKFAENIPVGRFGTPREIGAVIAFMISPMNSFVTGQSLIVDGGMSQAN